MYDNLTFKDVDIIQQLWNNYPITTKDLSQIFNVSMRTINKVLSGRYRVTGTSACMADSGGVRDECETEVLPIYGESELGAAFGGGGDVKSPGSLSNSKQSVKSAEFVYATDPGDCC